MNTSILTRKISIKLLYVIIIAAAIALWADFIFTYFVAVPYIKGRGNSITVLEYNILAIMAFAIGIIVFLGVVLLLAGRKIKYIKYISEKVKVITHKELGSTLQVIGNDELAELCMNINSMSTQLKEKFEHEREVEKTKTELITNVSHDLRTPLTAIIGYLDILRNEKYKTKEDENEYLNSTYDLSLKLKNLIDELFEYTKLSNSNMVLDFVEADISAILRQMVGEYAPVIESKGLRVMAQIPEEKMLVKIDIEKMARVFDNILSNSEKYSIKPSDITVKAEYIHYDVMISITNKGRHIDKDTLSRMFEKFYRVDNSRSSEIEGSGLGLAIAKKIVELHSGQIWAECYEDIITVNIRLPIAK